ncbi:rhomboid family intramembrane serine protease [Myxococcus sp. Y35]|uniref:rhomboid family intramembrane serine protease n=1 Tax=Pseudomyxococcus flavus TaxID=3115648 RepID=UPI003CF9A44D
MRLDASGRLDGMSAPPLPEPLPSAAPMPEQPGASAQEDTSFAEYLLCKLLAEQGFTPSTFPEAAELEAASDAVLTYSDGMAAIAVCVVDRERQPSRVFGLDTASLERIGKDCLRYSGTVNGAKLPVGIQVIEVGDAPLSAEDRKRLDALRLGAFNKVHLHAMHVDTRAGTVWANTWRRAKVSPRYVRQLLSAPRRLEVLEELAEPPHRTPLLTPLLLVAMALGFAAEHFLGVGEAGEGLLAPGVQTLVALGGVNAGLVVEGGQWWRLLTAPLLHGDVFHLALNGLCLWFVGHSLELLLGRAWLGLLLLVGALGGGALSMAFNDASVVSVGASGVLMALLGAMLAVSRRFPPGQTQTQLRMLSLQMLVPSLIPVAMTRMGGAIDFAAHLGGALAGGAVGLWLTRVWPRKAPEPPAAAPLGVLGWVAVAALVVSVGLAWQYRQVSALALDLIPEEALPTTHAEGMRQATDLQARYPRDPRAHLFQAMAQAEAGNLPAAETALRVALAEKDILEHYFTGTQLPLILHEELASVLLQQGREGEARTVIAPFCAPGEDGQLPRRLVERGLCPMTP